MKTDLSDTTFIIPVRLDSIARLENLIMAVEAIEKYFTTHIRVLEADHYNNGFIETFLRDKVEYEFIEDQDPVFYKTKYLNYMARKVQTPIVGIWDVDILLEHSQIIDAIKKIHVKNYDIAYPFDGDCYDTSDIFRRHYWINRDINFLLKHQQKMDLLYTVKGVIGAVGGAIFVKTDAYLNTGMENEAFYGWGLEDGERHYRWMEFDLLIYRTSGPLFHLSHPRDINSKFRSEIYAQKATSNFQDTVNYTKQEFIEKFNITSYGD